MQRKEVRIHQLKAGADGLSSKASQVGFGVPSDGGINGIADESFAVAETKAFDRRAVRIRQFDPNISGGTGRCVDHQSIPGHRKDFCRHSPRVGIGVDRSKPIEAQREPAKRSRVERHFAWTGLDDMPSCIVGSILPTLRVQAGPEIGLPKRPVERSIPTGAHQQNIGSIVLVRKEPRWRSDVDMRGAKVGMRQGRIEVLVGQVRTHRDRFGPMDEVLGSCPANRS